MVAPLGTDAVKGASGGDKSRRSVTVIVVGETARAANFSLDGYAPDQSAADAPARAAQFHACLLVRHGHRRLAALRVLGAGTRTLFRHPGVRPGRPARRAQTCLSYSVLWRDNNSGCKGACDRVAYEDLSVPEKDNQWCVADECYDERLLDRLPDIIREARRHGHRAAPERQPRA
ncbi:hypothetical protein LP420_14245 [Massilia sp. B-10]|nr:hypothetical protein LP420_14245 [Massilia sp. B-10]